MSAFLLRRKRQEHVPIAQMEEQPPSKRKTIVRLDLGMLYSFIRRKKLFMKPLVIGFTGRREGITDAQLEKLEELLTGFLKSHRVLCMHNDGEGSDQLFKNIANRLGAATGVTPKNLGHMARNRCLVEFCELLLVAPPTDDIMKKGSGTWETAKYMWKKKSEGNDIIVILGDGSTKRTKDEFDVESKKE